MKTCNHCRVTKPLSQFYKNRGTSDGRARECSDCAKQAQRRSKNKAPWLTPQQIRAQYPALYTKNPGMA